MPEGDTIAAIAAALRPHLVGHTLRQVWLRLADRQSRNQPFAPLRPVESLVGRPVTEVRTLGKHLLVDIERAPGDVQVLRVHLGLTGSWHRYAPTEPWQKSESRAWVVLRTDTQVVVCFDPRVVEWTRARTGGRPPALVSLGPDLLDPDVDLGVVVARAREHAEYATLADLLLDQRVACGLGNVYKSEVPFIAGLHPSTPVSALSSDTLRALYATGRDLLIDNAAGGARVTTGDPRRSLWVHDRDGQPCRRCDTVIVSALTGPPERRRRTFWCPVCQPIAARRTA